MKSLIFIYIFFFCFAPGETRSLYVFEILVDAPMNVSIQMEAKKQ